MVRLPPRSTRTDTPFPYPTLFRSRPAGTSGALGIHVQYRGVVMGLDILRVPVLSDNYVWLAHDPASDETTVIDPAVAGPVLEAAAEKGRSEDRRVGKGWVSTCRSRWSP